MLKPRKIIAGVVLAVASLTVVVATTNTATAKPECNCPQVYDPVYIIATGQMFTNACFASCAGYGPEDWTSGI